MKLSKRSSPKETLVLSEELITEGKNLQKILKMNIL